MHLHTHYMYTCAHTRTHTHTHTLRQLNQSVCLPMTLTRAAHLSHIPTAAEDAAADPKATVVLPSTTPRDGDSTPTTPHMDSPSDPLSGRLRDPTPTMESDMVLKCPLDSDPSPRPVPTPRQKAGHGRMDDEKGQAPKCGRPTRLSSVQLKMVSVLWEKPICAPPRLSGEIV